MSVVHALPVNCKQMQNFLASFLSVKGPWSCLGVRLEVWMTWLVSWNTFSHVGFTDIIRNGGVADVIMTHLSYSDEIAWVVGGEGSREVDGCFFISTSRLTSSCWQIWCEGTTADVVCEPTIPTAIMRCGSDHVDVRKNYDSVSWELVSY